MYCGVSRHCPAACPRKLKAASAQVEINPFEKIRERERCRKKNQKRFWTVQ
jgi:hypothetical protein